MPLILFYLIFIPLHYSSLFSFIFSFSFADSFLHFVYLFFSLGNSGDGIVAHHPAAGTGPPLALEHWRDQPGIEGKKGLEDRLLLGEIEGAVQGVVTKGARAARGKKSEKGDSKSRWKWPGYSKSCAAWRNSSSIKNVERNRIEKWGPVGSSRASATWDRSFARRDRIGHAGGKPQVKM